MSLLTVLGGASGSHSLTIPAQGVDFDGTYDYLSRSSDLVGNVDSKTFTFACVIYPSQTAVQYIYDSGTYFQVSLNASNQLVILGKNAANTTILDATVTTYLNPLFTFHILQISVDLANSVNRSVYINDLLCTVTWTTYTNDTINFTNASHAIGATSVGASKFKGRLQSVFLDYTYRDLSNTTNRRLFIDANGKPSDGWKALTPIIGMSIKDAATAHINDYGTGGNFTPNGTYATSNRGANQDNCVASYFNGTTQYLSRGTILTGLVDSSIFTLSISIKGRTIETTSSGHTPFAIGWGVGNETIMITFSDAGILRITGLNASNIVILDCRISGLKNNKDYFLNCSFNMNDVSKRIVVLNSIPITVGITYPTYMIGQSFRLGSSPYSLIGHAYYGAYAGYFFDGNIGELYFNTTYIDLATSNPFWDSVDNKPIPVRKVISNTGVTPLIAMPLDASNAGRNYGTGGDFTVNSGPYVGARGASEFWARSAKFDGSTGYLSRGTLTGAVDSKTFSLVYAIKKSATVNHPFLYISSVDNNTKLGMTVNTIGSIDFDAVVGGVLKLNAYQTGVAPANINNDIWITYHVCMDLSNVNNRKVYINGVLQSLTYGAYVNENLPISQPNVYSGFRPIQNYYLNGNSSFCYFTTDYIDFSQESNRLKFVDGLGYPLDLKKQIDTGVIPNPLIYLPFDDTTNLGKNLGTGGDFSIVGGVTAGADVLG